MSAHRSEPAPPSRSDAALRRVFSITGLIPVGAFLLLHIYTNTFALLGREAFDEKLGAIQKLPGLLALEVTGIFLPLLVHALLGVLIVIRDRDGDQPASREWLPVLQRLSGVIAFAFICFHVNEYWLQRQLDRMPWQTFYTELGLNLATPWQLAVYSIGVTSTLFHFAYGIWSFARRWGLVVRPVAQSRMAIACAVVGVALWYLSMNVVLKFAAGAPLWPLPAPDPGPQSTEAGETARRPPDGAARPPVG